MRPKKVYKIFRPIEWEALQSKGAFAGSADDQRDGFIHLSTASQLQGTLDKHYTQGGNLILAEVYTLELGEKLIYEVSRGGAEFPHLYAELLKENVSRHWALSPDTQGRYVINEYLLDEI